jgi:hypothetical protein
MSNRGLNAADLSPRRQSGGARCVWLKALTLRETASGTQSVEGRRTKIRTALLLHPERLAAGGAGFVYPAALYSNANGGSCGSCGGCRSCGGCGPVGHEAPAGAYSATGPASSSTRAPPARPATKCQTVSPGPTGGSCNGVDRRFCASARITTVSARRRVGASYHSRGQVGGGPLVTDHPARQLLQSIDSSADDR